MKQLPKGRDERIRRRLLPGLLTAALLGQLGCGGELQRVAPEKAVEAGRVVSGSPGPGAPAPAFSLRDLEGKIQRLSDFRGTPLLINFFASWCAPCLIELPLIREAHQRSAEEGFQVVGIAVQDHRETVSALAEEEGLSFPILMDGDSSVGIAYGVVGPPYTFFIDPEGTVGSVVAGSLERDVLEMHLSRWKASSPE